MCGLRFFIMLALITHSISAMEIVPKSPRAQIASLCSLADAHLARLIKPESNGFVDCLHDSIHALQLPNPVSGEQAKQQLFVLKEQICPVIKSNNPHANVLKQYLRPLQDQLNAEAPFMQCKELWHSVLEKLLTINGSFQNTIHAVVRHVIELAKQGNIDELSLYLKSCPTLYRALIEQEIQTIFGWNNSLDISGRVPRIAYNTQCLALTADRLILSGCRTDEPFKLIICKFKQGWQDPLYAPARCPEHMIVNGSHLVTASRAGRLAIAELEEAKFIKEWQAHGINRNKCGIYALVCIDHEHVATAGEDGLIKIWHSGSAELKKTIGDHTKPVRALAALHKMLVSGYDDTTVCVWDVQTGQKIAQADHPSEKVTHVGCINDQNIIVCLFPNSVYSYNDRTMKDKKVWTLRLHDYENPYVKSNIAQLKIVSGKIMYSTEMDKKIRVFDPTTGEYLQAFDASCVRSDFAVSGSMIAAYSGFNDILIKQAAPWYMIVLIMAWAQAKKSVKELDAFSLKLSRSELPATIRSEWMEKITTQKKKLLKELL